MLLLTIKIEIQTVNIYFFLRNLTATLYEMFNLLIIYSEEIIDE